MGRRIGTALLTAAVGVASAGCGSTASHPAHPRSQAMTVDQAKVRMQANLDHLVAALPGKPTLAPMDGTTTVPCDDNDAAAASKVQPAFTEALNGIPPGQDAEIFAAVKDFASRNGFKPYQSTKTFASYRDSDDFGFDIQQATVGPKAGGLSLGVSGPCLWADGTPPTQ